MSDFPFLREGIILDACCVINLYASGSMGNILSSIPKQVSIAAFVCNVEANRIYNGPCEDITRETELVNLQPLINEKLLHIASPDNDVEKNTVVNFSSALALDDGEAITAAIALHRQWSLVTDDKAAISFFMRKMTQLHLLSTLDIVKYWVDTTSPPLTVIRKMLENIKNRAKYRPHCNHHLYDWWKAHSNIS